MPCFGAQRALGKEYVAWTNPRTPCGVAYGQGPSLGRSLPTLSSLATNISRDHEPSFVAIHRPSVSALFVLCVCAVGHDRKQASKSKIILVLPCKASLATEGVKWTECALDDLSGTAADKLAPPGRRAAAYAQIHNVHASQKRRYFFRQVSV
jgi:hypothetical protein